MAKERLSMRKIKDALRLKLQSGLSHREVSGSLGLPSSTIGDYVSRAEAAGLTSWEAIESLSEAQLEAVLFPRGPLTSVQRPTPDYAHVHEELRRHRKVNLTLTQLWLEYKERHPDGYQYTQFCEHYRRWLGKQDVCLRQHHKAGEKVFVDYTDGPCLVDPHTGRTTPTHLFLAVWGASNYTYLEASLSQDLPSWIGSHRRALEYFGAAPRVLVPDNLKSGVTKACRYEPTLNRAYAEMAAHYGIAIIPARPRKPRDKAKAEAGVLVAQRWVLAVLRHRTFHSLTGLNAAIGELLETLNGRLMRKTRQSRRELFTALDHPAAQGLPAKPFEMAEWKKATVNIDYHVAVDRHCYSVPFRYVRETVEVRLTASTVEIFRRGERIAAHPRSFAAHQHTTLKDHMPSSHQRYTEWTPSRLVQWASKTGPSTARFVESLLASRAHPEQAYRACLGVFRLARSYPKERIEAATERALRFQALSYRSLERILLNDMDRKETETPHDALPPHENIRGGGYYN